MSVELEVQGLQFDLQRRLLKVNYDLLKIAEHLFNRTTLGRCF